MEAFNERRFEGRGEFAGQSVRGHLFESRVSLLGVEGVRVRHLNKHIDYSVCCAEIPNEENTRSLAFPTDMAITSDGSQLYVAAFGSSKVGVFDTASLEADTFQPDPANQITVSGGGPSGLALDEARNRLYVLTRFDNSISIIDLESATEVDHVSLFNPEPPHIVDGRRFLYDASFSSSHGDSACASCHIFGDFDSLAWDLGDPDSTTLTNPGPFALHPLQAGSPQTADFRSLKGPMTTQSLRGLANHGPMHWRGDRTGGNEAANLQPDSGSFDEDAAFKKFNVAFEGLLGRHEPLRASDMQMFTDFVLRITYPPNPVRNLDNSLNAEQQAGRDFYFSEQVSDGFGNCNRCHVLDPLANADTGVPSPGFFGTDGRYSFDAETQVFKIPHLRNMYQKIGMFGFPDSAFFDGIEGGEFMGDQVRGVGFLHDGSVDTLFRFHSAGVFTQSLINPGGFPQGPDGDRMRRQVEAFILVFDTNLAPIVGQQLTVTAEAGDASESIGLLMERADARECDLVGRLQTDSRQRGYLYLREGLFQPDGSADPPLDPGALFEKAAHEKGDLTFTCAPPGSGYRLALDRDEDGYWDADERALGSDLADPSSRPRVTFKSRRKQ